MGNAAFFRDSNTQSFAKTVYQKTSILPSVIMAQMAIETGYGTSQPWRVCRNPAGIKQYTPTQCIANDGGWYRSYASYTDAANAYANFYLNNSNYAHVLAVARSGGTARQIAIVIGQSPWAGSHYYANGTDGGVLISIINQYNLTQYDSLLTKAQPPPSVPTEIIQSVEQHPVYYILGGLFLGVGTWYAVRYFKQKT